jgi:hypothetical protein
MPASKPTRLGGAAVLAALLVVALVVFAGSGAAAPDPKPKPPPKPTNTSLPTIAGTPQVGQTLTASPGTWTGPGPITFAYQWDRCESKGDHCKHIGGATNQTYVLATADGGHTIRVDVTATNAGGKTTAVSAPTALVPQSGSAPPPPPPPSGKCAAIASISPPDRLLVDRIEYNPSRLTQHGQTFVARFHISSTKAGCVEGAIVYAAGVPFNRITTAPEVQTGADGWAQISFKVLPTLNFRTTDLIVLFVRARKPGDSVLAGVSNRRLVSVRTA